jgi:c-di-GMP-binding flagellar brake protein YcgR
MRKDKQVNENRVASRFDHKITVIIRGMDEKDELKSLLDRDKKEKKAFTLNFSLSGMRLEGGKTFKVGEKLNLDIMLPGLAKMIKVVAEVVWSNEKAAGIHFLSMKEGNMNALKAYLDEVAINNKQKKSFFSQWLHF